MESLMCFRLAVTMTSFDKEMRDTRMVKVMTV